MALSPVTGGRKTLDARTCAPDRRGAASIASKVKQQVKPREENKMRGIIVGVDGSGHSRHALDWAVREAAVRDTPLTVLTVQQPVARAWGDPAPNPGDPELAEKAREMAQEETDSALEKAGRESRPPSVTVQALVGAPAETLLAAAADADMLVVGSRGAGGFKRLLMGSVSLHATAHAHIPVVVIPDENV
jgi:nucleotide-binding universal stress UspA family protein